MAIEEVGPGGVTRRGGVVTPNAINGADDGHAYFGTDSSGNIILIRVAGIEHPTGICIATVSLASDFEVPINNVANKTAWDGGLILNTTGSTSVWTADATSKLVVPSGFTKARITSNLRINDAFAAQSYINHISKNGSLNYDGIGLETGERAAAGPLNISAQTSWISVTPGDFFETYILNGSATTVNNILATVRSWFQIELMR